MIKLAIPPEPAKLLALEACSRCKRPTRVDLLEDHSELEGPKMRVGALRACCPVCSEFVVDMVEADEAHERAWSDL